MNHATTPLRDSAFMQAFLDMAIPASEDAKMPSAGSLDLSSGVADQIEADAMLGPFVQAGLQAVHDAAVALDREGFAGLSPAARVEVVEAQLVAYPLLMMGVARHVYPAYYQHPRVLEGLGEPARPPVPGGFEIEPTDPRLLEKLHNRRRI